MPVRQSKYTFQKGQTWNYDGALVRRKTEVHLAQCPRVACREERHAAARKGSNSDSPFFSRHGLRSRLTCQTCKLKHEPPWTWPPRWALKNPANRVLAVGTRANNDKENKPTHSIGFQSFRYGCISKIIWKIRFMLQWWERCALVASNTGFAVKGAQPFSAA